MNKDTRTQSHKVTSLFIAVAVFVLLISVRCYAEEEIGVVQRLWRKLFKKQTTEVRAAPKQPLEQVKEVVPAKDEELKKMTPKERMKKEAKEKWEKSMLERARAEQAEIVLENQELMEHVEELQDQRNTRENLENIRNIQRAQGR